MHDLFATLYLQMGFGQLIAALNENGIDYLLDNAAIPVDRGEPSVKEQFNLGIVNPLFFFWSEHESNLTDGVRDA